MNIKSILLGASAAAMAATGAQAADLPVAPEPVDYVRVCDAFGRGFFYIPGTETCLKIGGGVRVEFRINDVLDNGGSNWDDRTDESTRLRARGYMNFDSRTNTEYGLLRTYVAAYITADNANAEAITLDEAFIQLGGFVAGRTSSYFDFYTGSNYGAILDQGFSDYGETNLFAYTAQFGNGFSASIAVEAPNKRGTIIDVTDVGARRLDAFGVATGPFVFDNNYGGVKIPDFVANLRVDQGWGSAQLMGALHHVYGASPRAGVAGQGRVGWAIGAGAEFNLPMIAAGDTFSIQASYAQGAVGYVSSAWAGNETTINSPARTLFGGAAADAYYNAAGRLRLATAWGIGAGFTHFWTSAISTSFTASYNDYNAPAFVNTDFSDLNLHGNVVWRPVAGLTVGAGLEYRKRNFDNRALRDQDALVGIFRVQRMF